MPFTLLWRTEDKIKFGNCGKHLDDIVYFRLPESPGAWHPELDSNYILNDPDVLQEEAQGLELPKDKSEYAVLFTQIRVLREREEIEKFLREEASDLFPESDPDRDKKIKGYLKENLPEGPLELVLGGPEYEFAWNQVIKFVRWVSKEEFNEKVEQAKSRYGKVEGVEVTDRWFLIVMDMMRKKQQYPGCKTCPLSIHLKDKKVPHEDDCFYVDGKHKVPSFLYFISNFGNFSVLTPSLEDEIAARDIGDLVKELELSRNILETKEVPLMIICDRHGKKKETSLELLYAYELSSGYRINLSNEQSALAVEYKGPKIFDIPEEAALFVETLVDDWHIFYFTEVYRKDDSFYGKFSSGHEMELPLIKTDNRIDTPFRGLTDKENIGKVEFKLVPAIQEYGYFQKLFEKYAQIAKKFDIPIKIM